MEGFPESSKQYGNISQSLLCLSAMVDDGQTHLLAAEHVCASVMIKFCRQLHVHMSNMGCYMRGWLSPCVQIWHPNLGYTHNHIMYVCVCACVRACVHVCVKWNGCIISGGESPLHAQALIHCTQEHCKGCVYMYTCVCAQCVHAQMWVHAVVDRGGKGLGGREGVRM